VRTMHDLKQELRRTADGFGPPSVRFEDVRRVASRRDGLRRLSAAIVGLLVVAVSASFLMRAFDDGTGVAGTQFQSVENGPIAYMFGGPLGGSVEGFRIALTDPSGGETTTLDGYLAGGAWSPDGSTLAFVRDPVETPYGDMSIWTVRNDGTGVRQLTDRKEVDEGDYGPRWSPDGRHILFFRNHPDRAHTVMVMDADGTGVHRVAGATDQVFFTALWSPDGSRILTVRDEQGSREDSPMWLAIMSANGSDERVLLRRALSQPQWSPDGTEIFFYSSGAVHAVTTDGRERTILDGIDPQGLSVFELSPDGVRILFTQPIGFEEGEELWIADVDGSDPQRIAEGLHWREPSPTWSPDGSAIAFVRDGDVWMIDLQTGSESQITDAPEHETLPAWAPDADRS
jgi:Tol biopolymer transport system component